MIDVAYHKSKTCSVIGYKNHAKKIIKFINENKNIHIKNIYHPQKKLNNKFTNSLNDVLESDAIFIICPTEKHFFYLNYLQKKKYNGYIFCEKLPVSRIEDVKKLRKFSYKKIYFNFNLEFSELAYQLKNKRFGKLKRLNIEDSKPFLLKKNINKNWRLKDFKILITNILPHYLYLIRKYLDNNNFKILTGTKNENTKIIDNISMHIYSKNYLINIMLSYSDRLKKRYTLNFTKAAVEIDDDKTKIFKPIIKLNSKKRFINSPIYSVKKNIDMNYISNKKSVDFFIEKMKNNSFFLKSDYFLSLEVNKEILGIKIKLI